MRGNMEIEKAREREKWKEIGRDGEGVKEGDGREITGRGEGNGENVRKERKAGERKKEERIGNLRQRILLSIEQSLTVTIRTSTTTH